MDKAVAYVTLSTIIRPIKITWDNRHVKFHGHFYLPKDKKFNTKEEAKAFFDGFLLLAEYSGAKITYNLQESHTNE